MPKIKINHKLFQGFFFYLCQCGTDWYNRQAFLNFKTFLSNNHEISTKNQPSSKNLNFLETLKIYLRNNYHSYKFYLNEFHNILQPY